jgi:putative peptide modification system cyclase
MPAAGMPAPLLRTLAVCDLVDSTALTEQLGDRGAAELVHKLDRLTRDLLYRHAGREIDKTDGFLVMFERPIQAVAFALAYQRLLREMQESEHVPLRARIGIHVGDVVLWENSMDDVSRGAKSIEVEGLVKPVAARLMSLALPGQILLSAIAYTFALRAQGELGPERAPEWRAHGRYQFKGVAEPMTVYEVGEPGIAPLARPDYSGKAHREAPWWRRPGVVALEIAVVLAAIAIPTYLSLRSPPAIAFADRDWIVVGDLKNLTGQGVLDDSLDAAFRISLEQSRYANLVPVLQINDALQRMQKPPGTRIDRAIGSEIALREGARALVLPSVAEVGGRVRVTAEVIDPNTQATVYVESADGSGLESILPSVSQVSNQMRSKLGETLASISANNAPLPKVTTGNLDALRAYALSLKAYEEGHRAEALNLCNQAVKIDPEFALAYLACASVHLGSEDNVAARADLKNAQALRSRLTSRDALRTDALLAMLGKPSAALEKYKLLGQLYPDNYSAYYNYALIAWQVGQYGDAIAQLKKALSEHNPYLGSAHYLLGTLQLAVGSYDEAASNLKRAQILHGQSLGLVLVERAAIQRQFAAADNALAESKPTGVASNDIAQRLTAISLLADQDHWDEALATAKAAVKAAEAAGPFAVRRYRVTELSLLSFSIPRADFLRSLRQFLDVEFEILKRTDDADHPAALFHVLFGAYLAARSGDADLANVAVATVRDEVRDSGYPNLVNLLAIAEAERARATGHAQEAVELLKSELRSTELYLTHIALRDAYASAGQDGDALNESDWLAGHRGLAYEELNDDQALQPFNVVAADLALLSQAEIQAKLGKQEESAKALNGFLAAWPDAKRIPFVARRLDSFTR